MTERPTKKESPAVAPESGGGRTEELAYRLQQQELLAQFGMFALKCKDFDALLQEATRLCAQGLHTTHAKAMRWLPSENRLLVRAGVGWAEGVVGKASVGADLESPAGYALRTGEPVISNHLGDETRFRTPKLLAEHGVKRAINVVIRGDDEPYGVLEVDSPSEGRFTESDLAFIQGFANLLGVAIERHRADAALHESQARYRAIIDTAVDAIVVIDENEVMQSFNGAAERMFGYTAAEAIGQNIRLLMPAAFAAEHDGELAAYFRLGRPGGMGIGREVEGRRKDGSTFPLALSVAEWRAGHQRHFTIIMRDVSAYHAAEKRGQLLLQELSHRVKNMLATVQAIARQTLRSAGSLDAFTQAFEARLTGIAATHDLLTAGRWQGASLHDIIAKEAAPYQSAGKKARIRIAGTPVELPPSQALAAGMVFHELMTNAVKYGALSVPTGRVDVTWDVAESTTGRSLRLQWTESGGPRVSPPRRRGFGSRLIERSLAQEVDGTARLEFAPAGLRCAMTLSLSPADGAPQQTAKELPAS
ncbi:MAG: PAS domain S-box protein [Pseudomonadota bacterium]|nr:PAS domain S-box protein [Pseudomonadota bacterium]